MRNLLNAATLMTTAFLLCSCIPKISSPHLELPKFKNLDIDLLKGLVSCAKKESEQNFTTESAQNTISVKDQIANKDIEYVDCDGKVESKSHGPVRHLDQTIPLPPLANPPSDLSYLEVENARTCSLGRVYAKSTINFDVELEVAGKKYKISSLFTSADKTGAVNLVITNSNIIAFGGTNVMEGANVIQIRYYGKCLKFRDGNTIDNDNSHNCETAELLRTRELTLQVKIDPIEVSGIQQISTCKKSSTH